MRRSLPTPAELAAGVRSGQRVSLAQAITLIESTRTEHQQLARETLSILMQDPAPDSFRMGISGAPGVGKSTLIEALGLHGLSLGKKIAVLAIDPSSALSKGSILGDKTRMEKLSVAENAFIRPSPAGDALGGVARKTRETILLVEAAGYDTVIIETVGVGQSEIAVHSMTDVFMLLLLPGAGDELQGIKRGIVEMADFLVVNKSDGERSKLAAQAQAHYLNATHLLPTKNSAWTPRVMACSALENKGVAALWDGLEEFRQHTIRNGYFAQNRSEQASWWLHTALKDGLLQWFETHEAAQNLLRLVESQVRAGKLSPFWGAEQVLDLFRHS